MEFHVVLEHDAETGHFTATVAGMPHVVVDASTEEGALRLVREAIAFSLEEAQAGSMAAPSSIRARVVSVDV